MYGGMDDVPPAPVYHPPAPLVAADRTAANAARFNQAKETSALNTRASIDALRNAMAASNRLGSGMEFRETGKIVQKGMGDISAVDRQNAISDLASTEDVGNRNFDAANSQASTKYSGELTARGQDIGAANARRSSLLELARLKATLY